MEDLKPYLKHIGVCGEDNRLEPDDERCICGLRQIYTHLKYNYKALLGYIPNAYKNSEDIVEVK